uniref:Apple domain-containing protein n=1 Tax=Panagrellus redivivus TaxID=6233 RepID=A0A7E4W078_PANRE
MPPDGVIPIPQPVTTTSATTMPPTTSTQVAPMTTTSTTTTTTTSALPRLCAESGDEASVFIASDTTLTDELGFGLIPPARTCTTCDGGIVNYYPSTTTDVPEQNMESMGSLTGTACPNMCICDTSGTCWRITSPEVTIIFWQYCTEGTCGVYTYIRTDNVGTDNDEDGLETLDYTRRITSAGQIFTADYETQPVTVVDSELYVNAASIGCNSCQEPTCKTTSE